MAGFEVVVRPVVFPDIRPRARPSLPPQDDPEKGFAVIKGNPASSVGLSHSWSVSSSKSRPVETSRRVDEVTVYQQNDDGTVNRKNFVKLKVANKITMREEGDPIPPAPTPFSNLRGGPIQRPNFYKRVEESDNVEITNRDVIEKNPDVPQ